MFTTYITDYIATAMCRWREQVPAVYCNLSHQTPRVAGHTQCLLLNNKQIDAQLCLLALSSNAPCGTMFYNHEIYEHINYSTPGENDTQFFVMLCHVLRLP